MLSEIRQKPCDKCLTTSMVDLLWKFVRRFGKNQLFNLHSFFGANLIYSPITWQILVGLDIDTSQMSSGFLRIPWPKANAPNKPNWDDWARPKCSKQRRPFGKVQSATDPPASLHVLVQVRWWQVMKIQVFFYPQSVQNMFEKKTSSGVVRDNMLRYVRVHLGHAICCFTMFQWSVVMR